MRCLQAIPGLWLTSNAVSPGIPGNRQPPAGDHIYKPQAYTGQKESCCFKQRQDAAFIHRRRRLAIAERFYYKIR